MRRWWSLLLVAAILTSVSGCSWGQNKGTGDYAPGDTISTYWFDFSLDTVDVIDSYDGYRPASGNQLVACRLSLKNTFDEDISMSQTDFFLLWPHASGDTSSEQDEMTGTYALPKFSNRQLEDTYNLEPGESREGDLVFEVPETTGRAALVFEEYYVDSESETGYSIGDRYQVWFDLTEA